MALVGIAMTVAKASDQRIIFFMRYTSEESNLSSRMVIKPDQIVTQGTHALEACSREIRVHGAEGDHRHPPRRGHVLRGAGPQVMARTTGDYYSTQIMQAL